MRRPVLILAAALTLAGLPNWAAAQTSQFGSRGLGLPVRAQSPRSLGLGGGLGLFDLESSLNPASIGSLQVLQAQAVSATNWRNSQNPFGEAPGRDTRFPLLQAAGPAHVNDLGQVRVTAGFSISGYTDRNFALGSADSLLLRGEMVEVLDTLISQGGLTDLRMAAAWNVSENLTIGAGLHLVTGASRVRTVVVVGGPEYNAVEEISEVSYLSYGASVGFNLRLGRRVALGGVARRDAPSRVERDSVQVGNIELPVMLAGGVRVVMHDRLLMAGQVLYRGWGAADSTITELGGVGARNAVEVGGGFEWAVNRTNVTKWPLRLGARYSALPFPLTTGGKGHEVGLSVGTGVRMGLGGRGGLDLALERVWRSEGASWREQAFLFSVGISIRP